MNGRSLYGVLESARRTRQPAVLADVKVRSPRDGNLIDLDRLDVYLDTLVDGGVAALSTPTDPVYFAGGMELAARIRARTGLPLLRKDFFCTPASSTSRSRSASTRYSSRSTRHPPASWSGCAITPSSSVSRCCSGCTPGGTWKRRSHSTRSPSR